MANSGWTNDQPLSLVVGTIPGEHAIIINAVTGDVIDVYDTTNALVLKIGADGSLTVIDSTSGDKATLFGNVLAFSNTANPSDTPGQIDGHGSTTSVNVQINSGTVTANDSPSSIGVNDSHGGLGFGASIVVEQRGTDGLGTGTIIGTLVQTDDVFPVNNVYHLIPHRNYTTNGSGITTVTHGAGFTPNEAFVQETGGAGSGAVTFVVIEGSFTSTQFQVKVLQNNAPFANNNYDATILCFG